MLTRQLEISFQLNGQIQKNTPRQEPRLQKMINLDYFKNWFKVSVPQRERDTNKSKLQIYMATESANFSEKAPFITDLVEKK